MITVERKDTPQIRRANANDVEAISQIEKQCFEGLTAYRKHHIAYLVLKANSTTLVESENDTLRGFIIVLYKKGHRIGYIETIDVDPRFRKQGVGPRLLVAAEGNMKERGVKFSQLEVSEGNEAAINMYRKAGYTFKQKLVGFYQFEHNGTCNAIRMIKPLFDAR
jgi:ribosomal protein S18 acetylase RimI-like enzyme